MSDTRPPFIVVGQDGDVLDDPNMMLTVKQYAQHHNLGHRTVQRYLTDGRLPTAKKTKAGWKIPVHAMPTAEDDAPVPAKRQAADVRQASATAHDPVPSPAPSGVLGMLGTLDDAAAALGTTKGGVRRLAKDGHLIVGPYGPHGSLRVFAPPR